MNAPENHDSRVKKGEGSRGEESVNELFKKTNNSIFFNILQNVIAFLGMSIRPGDTVLFDKYQSQKVC
jgi:hypothetical protein